LSMRQTNLTQKPKIVDTFKVSNAVGWVT
jgi:hypothetical protein